MTGRDRTAAVAGLDTGAAGQVVCLLVSAWLAMLGRPDQPARREPRS